MEMHAGRLIHEPVCKMYDNLLADLCIDCWGRPLTIDADDGSLQQAIRVSGNPGDLPVVSGGIREDCKA